MKPRERLAAWLEGDGIEIGALHHPLALPPGARVTYVDRLDEKSLREHYPELAGETFAPVSVIANAEDLGIFAAGSQDFVIANHLFEHVQYTIRALQEFWRVLKPGGILYMALPDQRLTFDNGRPATTIAHLLEEHRSGAEANRRAHYLDWATNVDGFMGPQAEAHADKLLRTGYSIHYHVWTPDTFLDFLVAARREFGLGFELVGYAAPEKDSDIEFILVLARPGNGVRLAHARSESSPDVDEQPRRSLRHRLAQSPLGPPVRLAKRLLRQKRPRAS